jgi:glycosyltransferase involved in cell wall biosynthesis
VKKNSEELPGINLSIIMPANRADKTIGAAIFSTIMFKPKFAKLLILLDGDNTSSKVLSWAVRRKDVEVYRTDTALGISGALNLLISKSTSQYISRMDADDICLPGRFKKPMKLLASDKADMVFTNVILFGCAFAPVFLIPQPPIKLNTHQAQLMLLISNPFAHPTLVARRQDILDLGGYRDSYAEDYDLWLRASIRGLKIMRLKRYGLLYRRHGLQHTKQPNYETNVKEDSALQDSLAAFGQEIEKQYGVASDKGYQKEFALSALMSSSIGLRIQLGILQKITKKIKF